MFKKVFLSIMIPSLLLVTHTISADDKDDDKGRRNRSPGKERRESKRDNRSDRGDRKDNRPDRREQKVRIETPRVEQKVRVETPRVEQNNKRVNPFSGQQGRRDGDRERVRVQTPRSDRDDKKGEPSRENQGSRGDRRERDDRRERGDRRDRDDRSESFFDSVKSYFGGSRDRDRDRDGRYSRDRMKERRGRWGERSNSFRVRFGDHRRKHHIFDNDYWVRFRRNNNNWYFDNNFSWFVSIPWPRVSVWLPWKWDNSVYYYYDDNGIFYSLNENDPYLLPLQRNNKFYVDAVALANSSPRVSQNQRDWMSLGSFALFQEDDTSEMPQEYISIAISKDGAVSGAYVNVNNNEPIQIQGAIDPRSQRIAWKFVGKNWPVMETGLYNLTQEESTILVHFSRFRSEPRVITQVNN